MENSNNIEISRLKNINSLIYIYMQKQSCEMIENQLNLRIVAIRIILIISLIHC